jgi:hypothetical protein
VKSLYRKCVIIVLLSFTGILFLPGKILYACGGVDVILSEAPTPEKQFNQGYQFDEQGNLLVQKSNVNISPALAHAIAEKFLLKNLSDPPLPLIFRKLEWVHRKLIYQFQSEPLPNYNGLYHLGPVNFTVERLILDVDAITGNLYLSNGCGAAPGQLLYEYNPSDFNNTLLLPPTMIPNNTNFIARKTGNHVRIDGKILSEEWEDTGHKYFYLGTYTLHHPSQSHQKPYYYVEVWTQIDDKNIYFAVKTDTPYWLALMFKDDPNLGMFGAYRDAKVIKSNGEVSDRYFTQRQDKTFYLEPDRMDNIIPKGVIREIIIPMSLPFP